jgi:scyllo-inositol 2-dehydrogenase (NAD+)
MGEVRCAVVGLGRLGSRHAYNLAKNVKGASLVAVADVLPESAEKTARELGVPEWTTDAEAVIQREDIDAVVIVTSTDMHAPLAKKAAEAGKALFIEKPLSLDMEESRAIVEAVEKAGVYCEVGFMRRFDPAYQEAKRRIAAGDIGRPLYYKAVSRDPQAPPESYIPRSGGIFVDMTIHDYDLARFLMEREVTEVTAMGSIVHSKEMEKYDDVDTAVTYLRFEDGAAGDIESTRNSFYGYDIRTEIIGTEGSLIISGVQRHPRVQVWKPGSGTYEIDPGFLERFETAYLAEMVSFIDRVREGGTPAVSVRDALAAQAIAVAADRSYRKKRPVSVEAVTVTA